VSRKYEKHLPYFTVLTAFQQSQGCPFCALEDESVRRYLHTLLGEGVKESGSWVRTVKLLAGEPGIF